MGSVVFFRILLLLVLVVLVVVEGLAPVSVPTRMALTASTTSTARSKRSSSTSSRLLMTASLNNNNNNDNVVEDNNDDDNDDEDIVDIAIVGAGIGGLCAGAILNTVYGKKVGVYESHYLPGGCAHAFDRKAKTTKKKNGSAAAAETFTFDSGPTILLGCSSPPFSALRQVLEAVNQNIDWIRYDGWGMIEHPVGTTTTKRSDTQPKEELRWKCQLGPDYFQQGPLTKFSKTTTTTTTDAAIEEFEALRQACKPLIVGAAIPAMAMRPGPTALIPLLVKYFPTLCQLIPQSDELTGTFDSYINGPKFVVQNQWLRNWLDALAFSLSGLPASRTAAAAMAFVLEDMHKENAALDYPKGGLGSVINALVKGVEAGNNDSKVKLKCHVESIDFESTNSNDNNNNNKKNDMIKAVGLTLKSGKKVIAKEGVICNAPVWSLKKLLKDDEVAKLILNNDNKVGSSSDTIKAPQSWFTTKEEGSSIKLTRDDDDDDDDTATEKGLLDKCDTAEMTGSFLHLHVAIDATGLDLSKMEAHYTVMDRGLSGDPEIVVNGVPDGPCGELNMIALSNPCVIDDTLAPKGYMILHAYGAGNEPFEIWKEQQGASGSSSTKSKSNDDDYNKLKEERSEVLWRAMESIIPDIKDRVVLDMVGSPLTHERFLRRPNGTYGAATEDYFKDGSTPISNFVLAGDSIFPGIGVPSVAISGASAANAFISPWDQWRALNKLEGEGKLKV